MRIPIRSGMTLVLLLCASSTAFSAEIVRLTPQTWRQLAPRGKEADCIYGDYVLRNDKIVAVVADPLPSRHANMTVRDVGGSIIDLTRRDVQSDQLSAYYPEARRFPLKLARIEGDGEAPAAAGQETVRWSGRHVALVLSGETGANDPQVEVRYELADGAEFLTIETVYTNRGDKPLETELIDSLRADRSFDKVQRGAEPWFWVYDKWWRQAYGVMGASRKPVESPIGSGRSGLVLRFMDGDSHLLSIPPGESYTHRRTLFPAGSLLQAKSIATFLAGEKQHPVSVVVRSVGEPVQNADVTVFQGTVIPAQAGIQGQKSYGHGTTRRNGQLSFQLPEGDYRLEVSALGRDTVESSLKVDGEHRLSIDLKQPGYVTARITSETGGAIPCKVQFIGREGTEDPFFGPDTFEHAVHNCYYSENGQFEQPLAPGKYGVIISYGPEYDAVFTDIEVKRGEKSPLEARLIRSVQSTGWVSADFHSHSSPSGDNTASQFGRVLNLLCEHLEFAPCTEHNRVDTYLPHLRRLGVEQLMATCSGMELTGQPLPLNHQNAFPLVYKPRTQDGGGPVTDVDPEVQIERLALWDSGSEKLVQQNHPDLGWLFLDKDGDGQPDAGHAKSFGFMDVIEVHPLDTIFKPAVYEYNGRAENNRILNWIQLINQGHRIPGVVNTDAHYNFHGSGFIRNYLKSKTDDAGEIETLDMVHAAERGNVIMTTGPFLEVLLESGEGEKKASGTAGDDVAVAKGKAVLHVRVQCPNWFDIDRVQVLFDGRAVESLNFSRFSMPDRFGGGSMKFDQQIPLSFEKDTHVMVVAVGEKSTLGPVMGPTYGKLLPIAVSNPIYADVDGGGFKPSGNTLGAPLPVKGGLAPLRK